MKPSATFSRAVFHGSSASSWNRMPTSDGFNPVSTVPASGCCSPITARRRLDLPEPDGPTRLTNCPSSTARLAPSRTASPPYEIVRSRTRRSSPHDGGVVQPADIRVGLQQAADDQALLDAPGGVAIDLHRIGIERVAVFAENLAELLEVEPGGHFFRQGGDELVAAHAV